MAAEQNLSKSNARNRRRRKGKKAREQLPVGSLQNAKVITTHGLYMYLELDNKLPARVHVSELDDFFKEGSRPLSKFHRGQSVSVRVLRFQILPRKTRMFFTGTSKTHRQVYECTMKPSRLTGDLVEKEKVYELGQHVTIFVSSYGVNKVHVMLDETTVGTVSAINAGHKLKHVVKPRTRLRLSHCYTATVLQQREDRYMLTMLDKNCIQAGSQVVGKLFDSSPDMGLFLLLPFGYKASVVWPDVSDCYEHANLLTQKLTAHFYQCVILYVRPKGKKVYASLRPSRISNDTGPLTDREILHVNDLKINDKVRGFVKRATVRKMTVRLGNSVIAVVALDDDVPEHMTQPGNVVELIVVKLNPGKRTVMANLVREEGESTAMDPSEFVPGTSVAMLGKRRRARDADVEARQKGAKKLKGVEKQATPKLEHYYNAPIMDQPKTLENAPHLKVSTGFVWDPEALAKTERHDSSSDSETEDHKNATKKKRRQKLLSEKLSEKQLFEMEKSMMDSERQPQTVDDYDRHVLSSPNSSIAWLSYMTFHLQSADVDKARAVAERALKTISFREEQEKLNVWVALMNLENLYGEPATVDAVFQRALEYNEPLTVYNHLVTIYAKTDKLEAAEQLYNTMVRRFSDNKDVWLNFGTFLMRNGRSTFAHKLLERSLKSLPKKEHVNVISRFAQLEFKHGQAERGKTMMESILSSYPKRTDVWSVYLDMMHRVVGDMDETRRIYERVITMKFSTKSMKFFFKRFLEFEKQHGTSEAIEAVKEKAMAYVQDNTVE